ncbi:Uncharacterized protein AB751O23_CW_00020 [Chlamydiales bacterium SCGC AB-751-O23]|jgi:aspartate kinase|nr:Uncharacterized protein AB751O23_CW_00020 [Chlamydiales bacterium SCGC AB-751-O23]
MSDCIVLKFGGAAVAHPESFLKIAKIIAKKKKQSSRLVVVVSAMGETTNNLLSLAKTVHSSPPKRELDMLLSVGERISISLLAMALNKIDLHALSFTGSQSGIITNSRHSEASIIDVKPERIRLCIDAGNIAIVAGFQGVSQKKEITTLGRGGSDTTAVALGVALKARIVEFYKDVEGVYNEDPKINEEARLIPTMTYEEALSVIKSENGVLHRRSVILAQKNHLPLKVMSFIPSERETRIGDEGNSESLTAFFEDEEIRTERKIYQ